MSGKLALVHVGVGVIALIAIYITYILVNRKYR